ncbi:hypothetical protein METP1_03062 [Methanosarcinales archaeon]|nr:hypothetical protein METP1_03062 [Methanosarcinales archaeon]
MKCTVRIPKNNRHMITIPIEVWDGEKLEDGDLIECDIKKVKK